MLTEKEKDFCTFNETLEPTLNLNRDRVSRGLGYCCYCGDWRLLDSDKTEPSCSDCRTDCLLQEWKTYARMLRSNLADLRESNKVEQLLDTMQGMQREAFVPSILATNASEDQEDQEDNKLRGQLVRDPQFRLDCIHRVDSHLSPYFGEGGQPLCYKVATIIVDDLLKNIG